MAAPGAAFADETVNSDPTIFIGSRSGSSFRRGRHDVSPKEASKIGLLGTGDESVDDIEIVEAVIIEIQEIRAPGPPAHFHTSGQSNIFETPVYQVAKQGISPSMALVKRLDKLRLLRLEQVLRGNTPARRRPHIADIKIFAPVAVEVTPGGAHPGSHIFYTGLGSHVGKRAVAIIAV